MKTEIHHFNTFDIGIKAWTKTADRIISQFGNQSIVEYPGAVQITGIPLLTYGAYTCYAGVAQSPQSGLFLFHFYEYDSKEVSAYNNLVSTIGGEPIAGVYGGIPYSIARTGANQFGDTPLQLLNPKDASLGGFNIMLVGNDILYAAGQFNP